MVIFQHAAARTDKMIIRAQGPNAFDAAVPETAGDENAVRFLQLVKRCNEHLRPSVVIKIMQNTHKRRFGFRDGRVYL